MQLERLTRFGGRTAAKAVLFNLGALHGVLLENKSDKPREFEGGALKNTALGE